MENTVWLVASRTHIGDPRKSRPQSGHLRWLQDKCPCHFSRMEGGKPRWFSHLVNFSFNQTRLS